MTVPGAPLRDISYNIRISGIIPGASPYPPGRRNGGARENGEAPGARRDARAPGADRQGRAGPDGRASPEMKP
ncbi:hypothetical protein GCM10010156_42980 [Planobispora rosea]|uniref:Uncharacterized protein n=1 Tax=Planobispora rosea TaxID=35762 RepID=A0A8J3WEH0_PLARO|nr:hypothetical protein GCM10010156_42980 [Planobispora rosea]GIH85847.1 hypothetical protein Pro02_42550 [Planobispora rosea]